MLRSRAAAAALVFAGLGCASSSQRGALEGDWRARPTGRLERRHLARPLDESDIREALQGSMGRVRACYEERLKQRPDLAGTLQLDLVIAPEGRVSEAHVARGSAEDGALNQCVLRVVRSTPFPSFEGDEVEVELPLRLSAE